jgi:DNA repair protein RecN (Recombination protein N)
MLRLLEISQFALIESLRIEFETGLNLLTGETGSGKSIIVDALGLLLGEKGYSEMIRTGFDRSTVTGVFELEDSGTLSEAFETSGLDLVDDELVIRRELVQNGKGRAFINNQVIPVSFLREIAPYLVDIHGQNEQQTLYSSESQLQFVDASAEASGLLEDVSRLYEQLAQNLHRIHGLETSEQARLRTIDLLSFQVAEIEKAQLKSDDEDLRLEQEQKLLANAGKLHQLSSQAYVELYEAEASAGTALKHASRLLEELKRTDSRCESLWEQLQSARISVDDVSLSLREYASNVEVNPQRLEWIENRMAEIGRLKKKYGTTIGEITAFCQKSKLELEDLQAADVTLETLKRERVHLKQEYLKKATELSERRKASAGEIEKKVERELAQLAMAKTRFQIAFSRIEETQDSKEGDNDFPGGRRGIDKLEFLLSPNPGEDLKPLVKIASGGEISRIMLALKTVKNTDGLSKTLVFDEVDAGIGGQTADVVGQKLKKLAHRNQILCVTHLPQIASYADNHYSIEKRVENQRTLIRVVHLNQDKRVQEIARMISGERMTESVLKHAAELLKSAAK